MSLTELYPLADTAALYAALRRDAFTRMLAELGPYRWDVDLAAHTVTFSSLAQPEARVEATAHLLATLAPAAGSIQWGWAHPQGDPEGVAATLRDHGRQAGISLFGADTVPFPAEAAGNPAAWLDDAAFVISLAGIEATGIAPAFDAPLENGTRALFLLEVPLEPLTVQGALAQLPAVLAATTLRDPRTAVWGLARLAGWEFEWTEPIGFSAAVARDHSGGAAFSFDENARIAGIHPAA